MNRYRDWRPSGSFLEVPVKNERQLPAALHAYSVHPGLKQRSNAGAVRGRGADEQLANGASVPPGEPDAVSRYRCRESPPVSVGAQSGRRSSSKLRCQVFFQERFAFVLASRFVLAGWTVRWQSSPVCRGIQERRMWAGYAPYL